MELSSKTLNIKIVCMNLVNFDKSRIWFVQHFVFIMYNPNFVSWWTDINLWLLKTVLLWSNPIWANDFWLYQFCVLYASDGQRIVCGVFTWKHKYFSQLKASRNILIPSQAYLNETVSYILLHCFLSESNQYAVSASVCTCYSCSPCCGTAPVLYWMWWIEVSSVPNEDTQPSLPL